MPPFEQNSAQDLYHTPKHAVTTSSPEYRYPHVGYLGPENYPLGIAELPAPVPPARPTSTPAEQLNEDELLACKLQQMKVAEAQSLNQWPSQYSLGGHSPHLTTSPCIPPASRPHSFNTSSQYGTEYYAQATQLQLSPHATLADLAPEVHLTSADLAPEVHIPTPLMDRGALAPEVVTEPFPEVFTPHQPVSNPTSRLPPPPADPTSLSIYLEHYLQVPYPPQWVLPPVNETLYGAFQPNPKSDWLGTLESQFWSPSRCGRIPLPHATPSFIITLKESGGTFRDLKLFWTMTTADQKHPGEKYRHPWTYTLKIDSMTKFQTYENLITPNFKAVNCTYVHTRKYNSLRFMGPGGRCFQWVSNMPVSTLNGSRYDTLRHALFMSADGNQNPLYGRIVADHTYWDGHTDRRKIHDGVRCNGCDAFPLIGMRWRCKICARHNICEGCHIAKTSLTATCSMVLLSLPDEALYIRSNIVDTALVVATLQVMKDREKVILRDEVRRQNKRTVKFIPTQRSTGNVANLEKVRKGDLGRLSYWESSDFDIWACEANIEKQEKHGALLAPKKVMGKEVGRKQSRPGFDESELDMLDEIVIGKWGLTLGEAIREGHQDC